MNVTKTIPLLFRKEVKTSKAFQKLSSFQKAIYGTGQNIRGIQNGLLTAKNLGINRWREISGNCHVNSEIIEELYLNQIEVQVSIIK
jgi:hypothetical protein